MHMLKLIGKLLLLGAARRWAKRPTAAAETAALVLVLSERRLGRGSKRDVLLRAAHLIFLPAAVVKAVRLAKYLAVGKRRGPGGAAMAPGAAAAAAAAAAALPGPDGLASAAAPADPGADPLADPAGAAGGVGPVPSFRHQPPPLPRKVPRAEWGLLQIPEVAPEYAAWVRCLRNVLAQQGLRSLSTGADPDGLELTRYLLYGGLLAAHKPSDAARALASTAARVNSSVSWRAEYPFMSTRALQEWDDVTWWAGPDPDGTLWLHVHLARMVVRCNAWGEGRACLQAIISQLEYGTRVLMTQPSAEAAAAALAAAGRGGSTAVSGVATQTAALPASAEAGADDDGEEDGDDAPAGPLSGPLSGAAARAGGGASPSGRGGAGGDGGWRRRSFEAAAGGAGRSGLGGVAGRLDDRIRVVVVGSGSNVRQALRMLPLFREFARLVQRHYPGRLRAMYVVDMPRGLRMSVGAVLNLLPNETRQKVKVCRVEDLPDCIAGAITAREGEAAVLPQGRLAGRGLLAGLGGLRGAPQQPGPGPRAGQDDDDDEDEAGSGGIGGRGVGFVGAANGFAAAGGGGSGASGLLLAALPLLVAVVAAVLPRPLGSRTAAQLQQLHELRMWLVRVVPALVMAAMACLTCKSLLARP